MGFWENLWQGTKRMFSKSCPECKTNDADLLPKNRIIRTLISQHPHYHTHWHQKHDGTKEPQIKCIWNKHIGFHCQTCRHQWQEDKMENFPG